MVLLLLVGLGLPAQASAALQHTGEGSVGIQLLDASASRHDDPRAQRYIVDFLPPGQSIVRHVLVVNRSNQPQSLDLYPAAASIAQDKFQFGGGRATNELTGWISLDHNQVTLRPGAQAAVTVTVAVPATASAGEQYAVIWASVTSAQGVSVTQVHRVGVRVYLDIGPGGEPPSSFTIGQVMPARDPNGVASLGFGVTNTGGRALDLGGTVTLNGGPAGSRAGPFNVDQGTTLAPGQVGTVSVHFPASLPNGPWSAEIHLVSGLVTQSATVMVTFPDPGRAGRPGWVAALTTGWGAVGSSFGVGVLVIALLYLVIRRGRKKSGELN